jgi:hypothetical protein
MDWMDGKSLEGGETKNNGEYYSSRWETGCVVVVAESVCLQHDT